MFDNHSLITESNIALLSDDFSVLLRQAELQAIEASDAAPAERAAQPLLNGLPYKAFRESVDLSQRRIEGTFFSGPTVASRLVDLLRPKLGSGGIVLDPTCGMGDLLLAFAETLPLQATLAGTLQMWSERLAGIELRSDLVAMAKARLIMLARVRGGFREAVTSYDGLFPLIQIGDLFNSNDLICLADGFLFNPPFGQTTLHNVDGWSSGQINAAALCLDKLVRTKRNSAPVAAVLPEVLRCGTRYSRFRDRLRDHGLRGSYVSLGRFDAWTDVDVFATLLEDDFNAELWPSTDEPSSTTKTVHDYMEVRVGPVVPHRHEEKGPWRRFVCAKTVPAWTKAFIPERSRRFKGTAFKPPFVVIRRTSSPSDKRRAVAAIICGEELIAVENHLIVLLPRDGLLATCERAYATLADAATSHYLNQKIRCRHLTTGAVSSIPWISSRV